MKNNKMSSDMGSVPDPKKHDNNNNNKNFSTACIRSAMKETTCCTVLSVSSNLVHLALQEDM